MEIVRIGKERREEWDRLVDRSPQGCLFCYSWYLEALGVRCDFYGVEEKDELKGGWVRTLDHRGYAINPVMAKYLGVIYTDFEGSAYNIESQRRRVLKTLMPVMKSSATFEYDFHPDFGSWLAFGQEGFLQQTRYTYRIDLTTIAGENDLLTLLSTRLRNKVNGALNDERFRTERVNDLESLWPVLEAPYRRQGKAMPMGKDTLLRLTGALRERDKLRLYRQTNRAGNTLAALGLYGDEGTAYLILNGTDTGSDLKGLNESLIFHAIMEAARAGRRQFDFEGSMLPSVESFYRSFGGTLTPYHRIWKPSWKRQLRRTWQGLRG